MAIQHHRAGRLPEAEALYRRILSHQPDHFDTLQMLARLSYQAGRPAEAVELLRRAIELRPGLAALHSNLGMLLMTLDRRAEAASAFQQSIALSPNNPDVLNSLGVVLHDLARLEDAIAAYREALALRPAYPEAYHNLGNAFAAQANWDQAIAAYRQALAQRPEYAEARTHLAAAHYNLGNQLRGQGRAEQAAGEYRNALSLKPDYPEALNNLGLVLRDRGQVDESIASYREALSLRPGYPEAQNNLANALKDKGQFDDAIAAYREALECDRGFADALNNLGIALKEVGMLDEALECYRRAEALKPDPITGGNLLCALYFHPDYDSTLIYQEHSRWDRVYAQPLRQHIRPHGNNRSLGLTLTNSAESRLRIGYVSPDFRRHVVGYNMLPLFREHDHTAMEIFCYSNVTQPDELTGRFKSMSDVWREIQNLNDDQAAELIRDDRIDILVDLTLHMARNRLLVLARKPAPVQVTFAGYPGTTGMEAIDYRLTDPYLDPPGVHDADYAEKSVRLPDTFWCYDATDPGPAVNPLPALSNGFVTFGCLNNFSKVTEPALRLWARVLRDLPDSRMLLLCRPGRHRQRPLDMMRSEGVDPARVEFVDLQPRGQYLQTHQRIDIALDTFPYNGHTTSLDSFWMGVPVVTLVGRTVVGRAGWSQLNNLGLRELAAQGEEQFVQIATALAKDLPRLGDLRATLRSRMMQSPLTDAKRFARGIEAAYREMWRARCAGSNG